MADSGHVDQKAITLSISDSTNGVSFLSMAAKEGKISVIRLLQLVENFIVFLNLP